MAKLTKFIFGNETQIKMKNQDIKSEVDEERKKMNKYV